RRDIAFLAASLNMLICFTLGHSWGVPTLAGIPNATHYAVFTLLLYFVQRVVCQRQCFGWPDLGLVGTLSFFFVTFPLSSVIGYGVALVFAACVIACARPDGRPMAFLGGAKILLLGAALLFLPTVGLWYLWSALVDTSARAVFADELYAYGR